MSLRRPGPARRGVPCEAPPRLSHRAGFERIVRAITAADRTPPAPSRPTHTLIGSIEMHRRTPLVAGGPHAAGACWRHGRSRWAGVWPQLLRLALAGPVRPPDRVWPAPARGAETRARPAVQIRSSLPIQTAPRMKSVDSANFQYLKDPPFYPQIAPIRPRNSPF